MKVKNEQWNAWFNKEDSTRVKKFLDIIGKYFYVSRTVENRDEQMKKEFLQLIIDQTRCKYTY